MFTLCLRACRYFAADGLISDASIIIITEAGSGRAATAYAEAMQDIDASAWHYRMPLLRFEGSLMRAHSRVGCSRRHDHAIASRQMRGVDKCAAGLPFSCRRHQPRLMPPLNDTPRRADMLRTATPLHHMPAIARR